MPPKRPDADRFAYADAARLLRETLDALPPPTRISVAEHAARHRWVRASSGAHLERCDHTTAPYLRGPMEALTEHGIETVAIVGPAASRQDRRAGRVLAADRPPTPPTCCGSYPATRSRPT